jgi:hypothetical protein
MRHEDEIELFSVPLTVEYEYDKTDGSITTFSVVVKGTRIDFALFLDATDQWSELEELVRIQHLARLEIEYERDEAA